MRKIDKDPAEVIPEICEKDLGKNLIIVSLRESRYMPNDERGDKLIAFIIRRNINIINWMGVRIGRDNTFSEWGFTTYYDKNIQLLDFIGKSWRYWHNHRVVIYICENLDDINTMFDIEKLNPALSMKNDLIHQLRILRM